MITPDRFIAQSRDRVRWLEARDRGVTATMIANAAARNGIDAEVSSWSAEPFEGNPYTEFGNWAEPFIMEHAHRENGILPNDWLIASELESRFMATPDGLSLDHREIAEAKTTGEDWKTVPIGYKRQIQWQLYVTGAERCLFLWMLRNVDPDGDFYPAWITPKTRWIERDETMISELIPVATELLELKDFAWQK